MSPTSRLRTAIIAGALAASILLPPLAASAQAAEFDGIPTENPSAITYSLATPTASPATGATPEATSLRHGAYLGDPDAPVTMQIYADYQCPHCRSFHHTIEPLLIDDYVRDGHIRLEFIDFPIIGISSMDELTDDSKESVQAAEATMCAAEQNAYMEYREALYEDELTPNSGALSDDNLVAIAGNLGLERDRFESCLSSGRYEHAVIAGSRQGVELGVRGTPTMVIDGDVLQPASYHELQDLLDQALEDATG